jgi:PAS domain S-box-containing protein
LENLALRRSLKTGGGIDQNMLRYVLDQSRDCIKILSPSGEIEYINSHGRCALEIEDFAAYEGKSWTELWPEESRDLISRAVVQAQSGQGSEIEASRPGQAGEERWWRTSISPLVEDDGELVGLLIISRDVTDHVRLRESEHTLALEMRHRLRNAYTVASAIVMQSARGHPEFLPFAEIVCARLADVALSQTQLLDAGSKPWTVADLIRTLIEAHGEGATRIRYVGDAEAAVDGHAAMVLALVLGELTNNSLKYGALRDGRAVSLSATVEDSTVTVRWVEQTAVSGTAAIAPRDGGSGYSMMERMARAQRASFEHELVDGQLRVTLRVRQSSQ